MSRARELREYVEQVLVDERIQRPYEFSIAGNAHQQVIFYVKGIRVKYQFPATPSDHRGMLNSRTSLRKAIRSASGLALSGAPTQRSVLYDGGVLPGEPDDVGAGVSRLREHPSKVSHRHGFGKGPFRTPTAYPSTPGPFKYQV